MIPIAQNSVVQAQDFSQLWLSDFSVAFLTQVTLAPATNKAGYYPGCLLALYTDGQYKGNFVNYDPNGTNGQNTAVFVLVDEYLTPDMIMGGTIGKSTVQVCGGGAVFNANLVYFTAQGAGDNLATAISQIGGKIINNQVCLFAFGN